MNKVVLITGASSGLGQELAYIFAKNNYNLLLVARNKEQLEYTKSKCLELLNNNINIQVFVADLENLNNIDNLIKYTIDHFGRLDILINNAGLGMWQLNKDTSLEQHKKIFDINYFAPIYLINNFLPYLQKTCGIVLNISSVQGFLAMPYHAAYVASKHALNGFIRTIRLEEPNIKFILHMPGWIDGTNLRKNAIGPEHKIGAKKRRIATVTVKRAALDCYNSIVNNKLDIYSPKYLIVLHKFSEFIIKIINNVLIRIFKL